MNQIPMPTPEQALENLNQAVATINTTRDVHLVWSLSVQTLREVIQQDEAKVE